MVVDGRITEYVAEEPLASPRLMSSVMQFDASQAGAVSSRNAVASPANGGFSGGRRRSLVYKSFIESD